MLLVNHVSALSHPQSMKRKIRHLNKHLTFSVNLCNVSRTLEHLMSECFFCFMLKSGVEKKPLNKSTFGNYIGSFLIAHFLWKKIIQMAKNKSDDTEPCKHKCGHASIIFKTAILSKMSTNTESLRLRNISELTNKLSYIESITRTNE